MGIVTDMPLRRSHPAPTERSLHPRIRVLWWLSSLASDLLLVVGATVVALFVEANTDVELPAWWIGVPAVAVAISAVARGWYARAAYRAWTYRLGSEELEIRYGVFWQRSSSMPYHRLQQVDVGQGPLERWLGMSTVQLRSAAATTDATIPGIADSEVDEIRRLLMQRAGRDDGA